MPSLGAFECLSKAGEIYQLKAPDAKNLVCYEPEEDAAFMKYCRAK